MIKLFQNLKDGFDDITKLCENVAQLSQEECDKRAEKLQEDKDDISNLFSDFKERYLGI